MMKTDREIAEELYRKEHPRHDVGWMPWGQQPELSDLWPQDQAEYVRRVRLLRGLLYGDQQ